MKRLLSSICVLLSLFVALSGCSSRDKPDETSISQADAPSSRAAESQPQKEVTTVEIPDFLEQIKELKLDLNEDIHGWLSVPNTDICDAVLFSNKDNNYYLRRDMTKRYDYNGVYYADYRSVFGDGSSSQLGINTCIYGHSMTDDKENKDYSIRFGQLHNFLNEDFALKTPYIFLSSEKENLAWEVFAVFIANRNIVAYNRNDVDPKAFIETIKNDVLPRSVYNYDAAITEDDKFLTLSTCIYTLPNGVKTGYPDTNYRFAVMAKLVKPEQATKQSATFKANPNVIIDPETYPN